MSTVLQIVSIITVLRIVFMSTVLQIVFIITVLRIVFMSTVLQNVFMSTVLQVAYMSTVLQIVFLSTVLPIVFVSTVHQIVFISTVLQIVFMKFCVFAIWTPPFLFDRLRHQEPDICIWLPSENRQFVIFVAVIGHYIPCAVMVFCYIKVFTVMRHRAKVSFLGHARITKLINLGNPSPGTSNLSVPKLHSMYENRSRPMTLEDGSRQDFSGSSTLSVVRSSGLSFGGTKEHVSRVINHSLAVEATTSNRKNNASSSNAASSSTRSTLSTTIDSHTRERRMFITLTYILTGYLICWFPFYVTFDTYAWRPELVPEWLYTLFFWMTYFNSTLNPFIYAYTSNKFRRTFGRMLTCKWYNRNN
ncbi:hypothetical protein ACJMK2_000154 [Sinanodonta woodiana]|uniref:G-protein coupled receptors family 1 profile domain-containing protein n=1 Tax=Sinanodonta woodiana TaxID=1069815 RepID=A0ABD3XQ92_SINWO